jgi:16S rRNA (adenine1518-N6/adenine1519-N6)-dimethyltransferase
MDSVRTILRRYGLRAKKSWGQCFLHDRGIVKRILDASGVSDSDIVVEIGAGLGILTEALATRSRRVLAIERDRDLADVLRSELGGEKKIEILETNALTFDFSRFAEPVTVVGNLPYNIASPLIFHLLEHRQKIQTATLMLQREVATRLVAEPGSKAYGIPSVLCQQAADIRVCFQVPAEAFVPRPKVESTVVRLTMRAVPRVQAEPDVFRAVVRAAFSVRRKTLRNALAGAFEVSMVEQALKSSGVDGRRRAETLSIDEFGRLSESMEQLERERG